MARLTVLRLKGLTKPARYGDGDGLWFQVRGPTQRSWVFRWKTAGKDHWMGLGPYPEVGLSEARDAARECRRLLRQGKDPSAERRASRAAARPPQAVTFAQVADRYLAAHEDSWKNPKHRQQWRNTLDTYAMPKLGPKPVASIETGDVTAVLQPMWSSKTETASRVRGRIEAVLDYAKVQGWRQGENPARWKGHLDHLLPAPGRVARREHHAALPYIEVGQFMAALATQKAGAALAMRFLILTAARTGEVIGATWREIDRGNAIWTIPAERMKAGKEHRVPLSDAALAVLDAVEAGNSGPDAPLFVGQKEGKPLSSMALLMHLRRMGRGDLTAHGFRSTFRDWALEATDHPREIAEMALAHTVGNAVELAYRRGDALEKRRKLMADWAEFCVSRCSDG